MTEEKLQRCKDFLDYFGVDYSKKVIYLTDGGNSVVLNPDTEWQDFLGYSINSIAEIVAKEMNKKIKYKL